MTKRRLGSYFNTSYVVVKDSVGLAMIGYKSNFNTSYVVVKDKGRKTSC